MGLYIFSAVVAALCGLAGFSLYRSHRFEKKLSNRLDLVVRASHTCASRMNNACEKLDSMQHERKNNFDYQRKVSEHQRVLLASLNRQVQQLDSHLGGSNRTDYKAGDMPAGSTQSHLISNPGETPKSSIGRTIEEVSKVTKNKSGVVRLEEMFRKIETPKEDSFTPEVPIESHGSAISDMMDDVAQEVRRAVNG